MQDTDELKFDSLFKYIIVHNVSIRPWPLLSLRLWSGFNRQLDSPRHPHKKTSRLSV